MHNRNTRADVLLLIVATIWGLAFVAQRMGMDHLGPFGFNAARFLLGAVSLLPLLLIFKPAKQDNFSALTKGGALAGFVLFMGATLQQAGLVYTTASNAGFITGLYIMLVPFFGLAIGERTQSNTWIGAALGVVGLYLLSVNEALSINPGDLLVLAGAGAWAVHVLLLSRLAPRFDNLRLAISQFLVCAVLSGIAAILFEWETLQFNNFSATLGPIIYAGLFSVGIAYTLQVVAQKDAPPSHAAIIMSLEAVFAALGGWLLLSEQLNSRELMGCGLMLAGMLISQLPLKKLFRQSQQV
ncbi:DMT family transporter [Pontibacterium sp. N1Y112]|uniref:DMT family transporter n=1 Tax=Pontibacterium sinense TaxID=2781979 RepID=A0A8J7K655_9GAMM|nr:DMT family transporter [Pontibacterium sinense]MBE9397940.1 DMT family transporter [Pontibacterium sinense]